MNLLHWIPYGRENAVTRQELEQVTGLSDRRLRQEIKRLIRAGHPILSSSRARGYWRSENVAEIASFVEESDRRRRTEAKTVEALRRLVAAQLGERMVLVQAHYRRIGPPRGSLAPVEGQRKDLGGDRIAKPHFEGEHLHQR